MLGNFNKTLNTYNNDKDVHDIETNQFEKFSVSVLDTDGDF